MLPLNIKGSFLPMAFIPVRSRNEEACDHDKNDNRKCNEPDDAKIVSDVGYEIEIIAFEEIWVVHSGFAYGDGEGTIET